MATVRKAHLKPESKKSKENTDGKEATDKEIHQTPERREIQFERPDQEEDMKDSDMMEKQEKRRNSQQEESGGPRDPRHQVLFTRSQPRHTELPKKRRKQQLHRTNSQNTQQTQKHKNCSSR